MGHRFLSFTAKEYHQMVKRQVIHGYYSWPGKMESFATISKFSTLDIYYHSTQYLSSLQVLPSGPPSHQGGAWPGRRY